MTVAVQDGQVTCADGARLSYSVSGDGFPIVLVNGLGNLKEGWAETIQSFERYFTVIRYDYRSQGKDIEGHGNGYSTRLHADDLRSLVDHLKIEQFVGIGISTGARILSDFAEANGSRVKALVLMGVALRNVSHRNLVIFKSWLNALAGCTDEDLRQYVEAYIPWIYGPAYLSATEPPVARIAAGLAATMTRQGTMANISATMESLREGIASCKAEPAIKSRTLILQGEYDLMAPPGCLDGLDLRFTNHSMHVIPNAGHNVRGENRQEFERLTLNFLLDELEL